MKETGEIKEQKLFLGEVPWMTSNGTFIINGAERVVVSQLVRSPGVYLTTEKDLPSDRDLCYGKLIPYRGAWMEFETSTRDVLSVKVDRKRKAPITTLLRAIGMVDDEELLALFEKVDANPDHRYMRTTLDKDIQLENRQNGFREDDLKKVWAQFRPDRLFEVELANKLGNALLEFYRRLRPGEPPSLENANNLMQNLFFNPRRPKEPRLADRHAKEIFFLGRAPKESGQRF